MAQASIKARVDVNAWYLNYVNYEPPDYDVFVSIPDGSLNIVIPPADELPGSGANEYYNIRGFIYPILTSYAPGTVTPTNSTFAGERFNGTPVNLSEFDDPVGAMALLSHTSINFNKGTITLNWKDFTLPTTPYDLTVNVSGTGGGIVSPTDDINLTPGLTYRLSATAGPGSEVSSFKLNGLAIPNPYDWTATAADATLEVVFDAATPSTIRLDYSIEIEKVLCAPEGIYVGEDEKNKTDVATAINYGGWLTGIVGPKVIDVLTQGDNVTGTVDGLPIGASVIVGVQTFDMRMRVKSFLLNDKQFASGYSTGQSILEHITTDSVIYIVLSSDRLCFPYLFPWPPPAEPPDGPPPTEPGGDDPGDDGTTGPTAPVEPPPGGGGSGPTDQLTPDDGGGDPFYNPPVRFRLFRPGWDLAEQTESTGLIVRWQDDNSGWSNEHVVNLGTRGQTEFPAMIPMRGDYSTRQWEFVMTDRAPLVLAYVEEEVGVLNE